VSYFLHLSLISATIFLRLIVVVNYRIIKRWDLKLTTHLHLVQRLRMCETTSNLLSRMLSWHGA